MRRCLVLFDFDGTLADSLAVALGILNDLGPRFKLKPIADLADARNMPTRRLMRRIGVRFWRLPRLIREFQTAAAVHADKLRLHEGITPVLARLHAEGHRLGILSSNREDNIRKCLRANGVEEYFEFVVGYPKLFGKGKALKRIIRKERADRADVLYIGDEVRDMEAGRKARVPTIAVTWGFQTESLLKGARPTHLIHEPRELLEMVGR